MELTRQPIEKKRLDHILQSWFIDCMETRLVGYEIPVTAIEPARSMLIEELGNSIFSTILIIRLRNKPNLGEHHKEFVSNTLLADSS